MTDYLMADLKSNIVGLVVQVDRSINLLQRSDSKDYCLDSAIWICKIFESYS